jgi:hypothetical protein
MASGTFTLTDNPGWACRITWKSVANVATNKSTLSLTFQIKRTGAPNTTDAYKVTASLWNGETQVGSDYSVTSGYVLATTSGWTTITSTSYTISHNSQGKAPSLFLDAMVVGTINDTLFATYQDAYVTFDTTVKKATITSAPNFIDTDNPTIQYSNPMGSNVTKLQVCIADNTGNTIYVPYRNVSKTGSSYTFQLTTTERQALINAVTSGTSITVRFYIKMTVYGADQRNYVAKTFSISDAMPDLAPAVVDMNETTKALTGDLNKLIKYYSKAACSSNATVKNGATIKSQKLVNGSVTKTNTNGVFSVDNVENGTFVFTVVDSRDNSASKTVTKTLINYVKLTCNQSVEMTLAGGTQATAAVTLKGNYFNGSFGAVNNTLTLQVRYKESGGSFGSWQTLSSSSIKLSGNTYSLTSSITGLQYDKSYVFQCRAVDRLATIATGEYTAKLLPIFDWGEDDFNFNVPVSFQGDQMVDFIIEQGTASMGSNGTWYWSKWKSGKAECYGMRNYGNMAISTAWGSLFISETFTQSFPSGLFKSTPLVVDITSKGSGNSTWVAQKSTTSATSSGEFVVIRPVSTTVSQVYISFHVIGRWK